VLNDLLIWFELDGHTAAARGVHMVSSELPFGGDGSVQLALPDGRRLAVRGSVDRIDRRRTGELIVMDHKTGRDLEYRHIDADDPTEGATKFQLPTYAAAALAMFADADRPIPSVIAEYDFFGKGNYQRYGYAFDDNVWSKVTDDLGQLLKGIESGLFPATPDFPKWEFRIGCHYCQPDGLGVAERFGEWQLKQGDPRFAEWAPSDDSEGGST
jgi:hypothetical protein